MSEHFEVKQNPELGRYSTATKNVAAGDVLFEEFPFAIGPKPNTSTICLVCCCPLDGSANGPRCPKCRWPLCENCVEHEIHQKECELFVENRIEFQDFASCDDACMQLDCITPLRLLLEKESNPKRWDEEISLMEYHEATRRQTEQWLVDQTNIVDYLHGPCKLKDRFPEDLIHQVCGILEINAFEVRMPSGCNAQGIYPKTAIMAHSCVPNTSHSVYPSDRFKIRVRATVDINEGDMLNTTYTNLMVGTTLRQEHLKAGKFFICHCQRCSDPTELGTHFSSFKCGKCDPGLIYPSDPFDSSSPWNCKHCEFKTTSAAIQKALNAVQMETDAVESIAYGPERLEKCEQLFRKYRSIFHPQHYVLTFLRQHLIDLYGRVDGYELQALPDVMLEHKMDLCHQVLNVLNVLYPGKTRARAMLLYEIHAPIVLTTRSAYTAGVLEGEALRKKLQHAVDLLEESTTILEWEDCTSPEYVIAQVGKDALMQLKQSITTID